MMEHPINKIRFSLKKASLRRAAVKKSSKYTGLIITLTLVGTILVLLALSMGSRISP